MAKESKKEKKGPKKLTFIEDDEVKTVFTDVVQISISNETVALDLALRNKDNETAKITHRVYMTVPHFVRFTNVCKELSGQIVKKVEEEENGSSN